MTHYQTALAHLVRMASLPGFLGQAQWHADKITNTSLYRGIREEMEKEDLYQGIKDELVKQMREKNA